VQECEPLKEAFQCAFLYWNTQNDDLSKNHIQNIIQFNMKSLESTERKTYFLMKNTFSIYLAHLINHGY